MFAVSGSNLRVADDGRTATIEVIDQAVVDEPDYPADGPSIPALLSFRISWLATGELRTLEDPTRYFRIDGYAAEVTAEFSVVVPSTGFAWRSDPPAALTTPVAVIGREVNGVYYEQGVEPDAVPAAVTAALGVATPVQ